MQTIKLNYYIKLHSFFVFIFLLIGSFLIGQERVTLSGYITDNQSNETLFGVNVIFPKLQIGTTSNEYGFYSITISKALSNTSIGGLLPEFK